MIYHLDTIPVWEAMEKETPCDFAACTSGWSSKRWNAVWAAA